MTVADLYYPPGAFYFSVTLIGLGEGARTPWIDSSFQEVKGISAKFETDKVVEGGENRFVWHLPKYVTYPNLVLSRGVVTLGSDLSNWILSATGSGLATPIEPKDLLVILLGTAHLPLSAWSIVNAYPVRWELGALSSDSNKVLIETLEFSYNYFTRVLPPVW